MCVHGAIMILISNSWADDSCTMALACVVNRSAEWGGRLEGNKKADGVVVIFRTNKTSWGGGGLSGNRHGMGVITLGSYMEVYCAISVGSVFAGQVGLPLFLCLFPFYQSSIKCRAL